VCVLYAFVVCEPAECDTNILEHPVWKAENDLLELKSIVWREIHLEIHRVSETVFRNVEESSEEQMKMIAKIGIVAPDNANIGQAPCVVVDDIASIVGRIGQIAPNWVISERFFNADRETERGEIGLGIEVSVAVVEVLKSVAQRLR